MLSLLFVKVFSQDTGKLNVILHDLRIERLVDKHIAINKEKETISGYRIQICSSANRNLALEIKAELQLGYPDLKSYLSYHQPYYKLRIGDYHTRLEAEKHRQLIIGDYKDAFIVSDEIFIEELKKDKN